MASVLAIGVGAFIGALLRWRLALWLNAPQALLPWGTLAANWIGAYAIGLTVAVLQAHPQIDPVWRLAIITGLLGALTTFSTFSVEVVSMLQHGRVLLALGVSALHLVGSLALTWLGLKTLA